MVMNKKVMLAAFARSGTKSIADFFRLYGIQSGHQPFAFPDVTGCYDILNPPKAVDDWIEERSENLMTFEACWSSSYILYQLQKARPEIEFLIMIRSPRGACNSLLHFFHHAARAHKYYNYDMHPNITLDTCASKYNEIYIMLIRQILAMDPRPRLLKFEDYVQGKYIEPLLDLFEIEKSEENLGKAKNLLSHKVNSRGDHDYKNTQKHANVFPLFGQGEQLYKIIESLCQELSC